MDNKKYIIVDYLFHKAVEKLDDTQMWLVNISDREDVKSIPKVNDATYSVEKCINEVAHDVRTAMDMLNELYEILQDNKSE